MQRRSTAETGCEEVDMTMDNHLMTSPSPPLIDPTQTWRTIRRDSLQYPPGPP